MKSQKLREVCEKIVDCEHKTAPTQEAGYPSIRTPNIGRGRLILDEVNRVSEEVYNEWIRRAVPKGGDLILAREAPVGNVAIIPKDLNVCLGQRTVLLRSDRSKVVPEYLVYLLLGDEVQAKFNAYASGATVPHLNVRDIRNLKLPSLPPLPTQRKIAAILSAYDDLIENNTRRIAILEEMAQLLYREWFVHFRFPGHEDVAMVDSELGAIPEGWEVVAYTDVADVLTGSTPRTKVEEYWNGPIPFFSPRDISTPVYVLESERSITELGLDNCSSDLYSKNTVFITARGTVGRVIMPAVPMAMNQTCYALRGRDEISQYYVFLDIQNQVERLKQRAHGAVFDTIIIDTFRRLNVITPPKELIGLFHARVAPIFEQILNLLSRNVVLRRTRDLLLPCLVSGELDVADLPIAMEAVDSQ